MSKLEEILSSEVLGFDPEELTERYKHERDRRIREDAESQFIEIITDSKVGDKYLIEDPYAETLERDPIYDTNEVVIIGGGWVGMMIAARLNQAEVHDIRIIESGADFGGTWYWNRYPGAQCDIESYSYLPLLEETGYIPKLRFSFAPEIFEHAQRIGRHFGLYKNALFQTWVTELHWSEGESMWIISTNRGDVIKARYVCLGTGPANRPRLPGIAGIDDFKGHSFHTCRWDYEYTGGGPEGNLEKLVDKNVAIIGTGATAVQCVPALGESAKHLYVIQRTPSSVDYRTNPKTDPDWAAGLKPGWQAERQKRFGKAILGLGRYPEFDDDGWTRLVQNLRTLAEKAGAVDGETLHGLTQLADFKTMEEIRRRVDETIKDQDLAEKLKAYYNQFCKRPTFNENYLETFNRRNVELVDVSNAKGIDRITQNGFVANSIEYEVDCIIYASGFEITSSYERRIGIPIFGISGESIYDHWKDGMRTMHGMMSRGFPNLFMCGGLFVFQLGANYAYGIDVQAEHVAHTISELSKRDVKAANVSPDAEQEWIDDQLSNTAAQAQLVLGNSSISCTPGYYNQEGTREKYRNVRLESYGKGLGAYRKVLKDWRDSGELRGLELTS